MYLVLTSSEKIMVFQQSYEAGWLIYMYSKSVTDNSKLWGWFDWVFYMYSKSDIENLPKVGQDGIHTIPD